MAAESQVFRFIDDTHPSTAKVLENTVVRDVLAHHGRPQLLLAHAKAARVDQVNKAERGKRVVEP